MLLAIAGVFLISFLAIAAVGILQARAEIRNLENAIQHDGLVPRHER